MPNRRFAPSFILTVSALAAPSAVSCSKPQPKELIEPDKAAKDAGNLGSKAATESDDGGKAELAAQENPPSPKVFRKRVHTAKTKAPPAPFGKAVDLEGYAIQNPNDPGGHAVFVASDDSCFIKVPRDFKKTPMPPGFPWFTQQTVDCPVEADDPAYDECHGQLMAANGKPDCYCYYEGGNPPPPPTATMCPKHKK